MLAILARKYVFFRIVCSVKIAHKNEKYCQWSVVAKFKLTICSRSNTQQCNARTSPWVNSFRNKFLRNHHHWLRHIFLVHSQKSMMKYENVYMKKENTCFLCVWPLLSRLITWTKHTNLIFVFFLFCSSHWLHTAATNMKQEVNQSMRQYGTRLCQLSAHTLPWAHTHTHALSHLCHSLAIFAKTHTKWTHFCQSMEGLNAEETFSVWNTFAICKWNRSNAHIHCKNSTRTQTQTGHTYELAIEKESNAVRVLIFCFFLLLFCCGSSCRQFAERRCNRNMTELVQVFVPVHIYHTCVCVCVSVVSHPGWIKCARDTQVELSAGTHHQMCYVCGWRQ